MAGDGNAADKAGGITVGGCDEPAAMAVVSPGPPIPGDIA